MGKRKQKMALGDDGRPFFVDNAAIRAITSRLKVVPWPRVDGVEIHTCGIDEEALGLNEYIAGWCRRGYYVRSDRTPQQAKTYMAAIDWLRVARIGGHFGLRPGSGTVVISDRPVWWITEVRYVRLMKHCFKRVDEATFDLEVHKAIEQCKRGGQKPVASAGTLEETH